MLDTLIKQLARVIARCGFAPFVLVSSLVGGRHLARAQHKLHAFWLANTTAQLGFLAGLLALPILLPMGRIETAFGLIGGSAVLGGCLHVLLHSANASCPDCRYERLAAEDYSIERSGLDAGAWLAWFLVVCALVWAATALSGPLLAACVIAAGSLAYSQGVVRLNPLSAMSGFALFELTPNAGGGSVLAVLPSAKPLPTTAGRVPLKRLYASEQASGVLVSRL